MLDQHQKSFIKLAEQFFHSHSHALRDFYELAALSLANWHQVKNAEWKKREDRYFEILKAYTKEEANRFPEMLACVVNSLSGPDDSINFHDCLGELLMSDEVTGRSKWDNDVCFTPKEVAYMMGKMTFSTMDKLPEKGYITLSEPASGAGSMVIQACRAFNEAGFNYQQQMHVTATEVRADIAHMAYIQFSLLHIPAVVIHGNSLSLETWSVWKTPAHDIGFWDAKLQRERQKELPQELIAEPIAAVPVSKGQIGFDFNLKGEARHESEVNKSGHRRARSSSKNPARRNEPNRRIRRNAVPGNPGA